MDYLNCKDLPIWAQILVGVKPDLSEQTEEERREKPDEPLQESAHAA